MARVYPSAGSAYTYVAKELNALLGYVVGWSMLMDYLLNPIICAIWCSAAAQNVLPGVPYAAWAVAFVLLFNALNLRGVRSSGRVNAILTIGMSIVLVVFLAYAVRYIALVVRPVAGQWLLPFYDPATFSPSRLFRGTSVAVLTYMGFDGISHHVRRGRERKAQHFAGHGSYLSYCWSAFCNRGLRSPTCVALPYALSRIKGGHCLRARGDACRRPLSLAPFCERNHADRQERFR